MAGCSPAQARTGVHAPDAHPSERVTGGAYGQFMANYPDWDRPLIKALIGDDPEGATKWNTAAARNYDESYSGRWFDVLADHEHKVIGAPLISAPIRITVRKR